jgi:hypothetical protein
MEQSVLLQRLSHLSLRIGRLHAVGVDEPGPGAADPRDKYRTPNTPKTLTLRPRLWLGSVFDDAVAPRHSCSRSGRTLPKQSADQLRKRVIGVERRRRDHDLEQSSKRARYGFDPRRD